jgi:hypothetical protein
MIDNKFSPTEALKKILMNREGVKRYNSILIEKFINVFVDPAKIAREQNLPSNSKLVNSSRKAS